MATVEEYIREMRARGFDDQLISQKLIKAGINEETVKNAFSKVVPSPAAEEPKPEPKVMKPEDAMKLAREEGDFENIGFLERCKLILLNPEKFFSSELKASLKVPILHFLLISLISIAIPLIASLIAFPLGDMTQYMALAAIFLSPIVVLVKLTLVSVLFFIIEKILVGKGSLSTTLKIFLYSTTLIPPLIVPILNILYLPFYILYLPYTLAIAFSKTHKISILRSYILLTIPILLTIILLIAGIIIAATIFMSTIMPMISGLGIDISTLLPL